MYKTVVIIGLAHNGTTMLTGIFECLGVPMGENVLRMAWEDQDFRWAIKAGERELVEFVELRNAQYDTWGVKHVGLSGRLPLLNRVLRNPVFFAILKDPVSVTQRRTNDAETPFIPLLVETIHRMCSFVGRIDEHDIPVNVLSYTHAVTKPRAFVEQVVCLSGLSPSPQQIEAAVSFISPNTTGNWREPYPQVVRS